MKLIADWAASVAQDIIAENNRPPESASLPTLEQIALLSMIDGRSVREERHVIINRLIDGIQDRPVASDYRNLVERRWCEKLPDARWHTLTPIGAFQAKRLLRHLCKVHNVHRLKVLCSTTRYDVQYACTCGHAFSVRKGWNTQNNAATRFGAHLQRVAAPTMAPEHAHAERQSVNHE